jgi:hypothetical protein
MGFSSAETQTLSVMNKILIAAIETEVFAEMGPALGELT